MLIQEMEPTQGPTQGQLPTPKEPVKRRTRRSAKVIVRSNGVVTYVSKDIAINSGSWATRQRLPLSRVRIATRRSPVGYVRRGEATHPASGGATYVYNVIDVAVDLQKLLKQALVAVGHPEGADRSHHFGTMVALRTPRGNWYAPSTDPKRPSARSSRCQTCGLAVDDPLDTLVRTAGEVSRRNPELAKGDEDRIARTIAIAAVRISWCSARQGHRVRPAGGAQLRKKAARISNMRSFGQQDQKLHQKDGLTDATISERRRRRARRRQRPRPVGAGTRGPRLDEIVEQVIRSPSSRCWRSSPSRRAGLQRLLQPATEPLVDPERGAQRCSARGGGPRPQSARAGARSRGIAYHQDV